MDVSALSDQDLREELISYGVNTGPITGTTRTLYEKKLANLRKDGVAKPKAKPSTPVRSQSSKSPARASAKKSPTRRSNTGRLDVSADEADSDPEHPVPTYEQKSPITSSPKRESRTPIPIPGLNTTHAPSSAKKWDSVSVTNKKSRIQELRDTSAGRSSSGSQSTPVSQRDSFDRPGATPPRNSAMRTKTTTSYYTPDLTSTVRKTVRSGAGSAYNNLGHTTDEEDTRGEESERIIFRDTPRSPKDSPIVRLWKRLSGNGDEFKAGPPGTYYDMKVGGHRTRVENDTRAGRIRMQHQQEIVNWWDDIPRLLLIIFSIFFVILAIGYVTSAHPDTLANGAKVVAASTRDMVGFFYQYLIVPSAVLAALAVAVIAVYYTHRYYRNSRAEEEGAFFDLVEKITDTVRDSAADGEEYISVPHVRDVIFPPARRRPAELARWERAVEYVNDNESRIATETRLIRGHECAVWKWLEAKKTGWQGKAFAEALSPNVPKQGLTKFLKIRDMVANDGSDRLKAELDMRDKLRPIQPLHVGYCADHSTNEKLIFAMFSTNDQAHKAFTALHGEWYCGRLINVKYVRDIRYFDRFPEAANFEE